LRTTVLKLVIEELKEYERIMMESKVTLAVNYRKLSSFDKIPKKEIKFY
jgi:hypothetical protein